MKILLVNNFYYNRGGDCTYLFSLKKLLEEKGHKVSVFSMHHPQNYESEYSSYFVSYINYADEVKNKSIRSALKVLFRSIYSIEAKKKMEKLIRDESPDIVHLNNIRHHLTPSILSPIKKNNIPIVWTLHDYQLICPNISFLAGDRICERCKKRKYYWPPMIKCKKGSFFASAMAAIEHTFQILSKAYASVDLFICPSYFSIKKFTEYGFHENKLTMLNYFIEGGDYLRMDPGDYLVYVGRLSVEKGIKTLINAVIKTDSCKLKIIGDGPIKDELLQYVESKNAHDRIELLGHKSREEVFELIQKCKFLVIPSEWYEVTGLVMFEAYACGKTVIGSRIGGIPEFIREGETGMTFEPGNEDDLRSKIEHLSGYPEKIIEMGKAGRDYFEEELGPKKHYDELMKIYNNAIEHKNK